MNIRKRINIILQIVVLVLLTSSCMQNKANMKIELTDSNFINQYLEIYYNYNQYVGKSISLDGAFHISENDEQVYYMIIRHAHGICSEHEYEAIGFEIDTSNLVLGYAENDWIKITGILDVYYDDYGYYLIIRKPQIEHLETNGDIDVY